VEQGPAGDLEKQVIREKKKGISLPSFLFFVLFCFFLLF